MEYRTYNTGSRVITESVEGINKSLELLDKKFSVKVEKAPGQKCDRCWNYSEKVGTFLHRPLLCERCIKVIDEGILAGVLALDEEGYYWTANKVNNDEAHLPMTDHIDYWVEKYGEKYRKGLEGTKANQTAPV